MKCAMRCVVRFGCTRASREGVWNTFATSENVLCFVCDTRWERCALLRLHAVFGSCVARAIFTATFTRSWSNINNVKHLCRFSFSNGNELFPRLSFVQMMEDCPKKSFGVLLRQSVDRSMRTLIKFSQPWILIHSEYVLQKAHCKLHTLLFTPLLSVYPCAHAHILWKYLFGWTYCIQGIQPFNNLFGYLEKTHESISGTLNDWLRYSHAPLLPLVPVLCTSLCIRQLRIVSFCVSFWHKQIEADNTWQVLKKRYPDQLLIWIGRISPRKHNPPYQKH